MARLHTADYVEARDMLLPAADYLARAVRAAEEQGQLSGALLAVVRVLTWILEDRDPISTKLLRAHPANTTKAADTYISLGSVSYSTTNERFFSQALDYLRLATQIPGYTLCAYLQQYVVQPGHLYDIHADLSPRFLDDYGRL